MWQVLLDENWETELLSETPERHKTTWMILLLRFIFVFISVYVCVSLFVCMPHVCRCPGMQGTEEGMGSPGAGFTYRQL